MKSYDIDGWLKMFVGSNKLVEVISRIDEFGGKIIDYNEEVIVMDEYNGESEERLGRMYVKRDSVYMIVADTPGLRLMKTNS
jgi:hypothetical protein